MPDFTKKHYEKVTKALSTAQADWNSKYDYMEVRIAHALADMFEQDNPKFNRERFIAAVIGE